MSDGSDDGPRWSRRGFLAGVGSSVFVGTGNASADDPTRLGATVTVETDLDARRLANALAADLGNVSGVETTVRITGSDPELTEPEEERPVVTVTAHDPSRETGRNDATDSYTVPLDLARFVPSRTAWYSPRSRMQARDDRHSENVESWVEYETDSSVGNLPLPAHLERVRPARPPGSAATVLVYGTRAFQYASGFGGRGYYEVNGDRLQPLTAAGRRSTTDGVPVVRCGRVAASESAVERLGAGTVEAVLSRYGATGV